MLSVNVDYPHFMYLARSEIALTLHGTKPFSDLFNIKLYFKLVILLFFLLCYVAKFLM